MVNSPKRLKDVADFGGSVSVTDRSDALQTFRESAIDCSAVYGIDIPTCIFFGITGVYGETEGIWGSTEIGVVIYGRIRMCYLWFAYTPVLTVSFDFS